MRWCRSLKRSRRIKSQKEDMILIPHMADLAFTWSASLSICVFSQNIVRPSHTCQHWYQGSGAVFPGNVSWSTFVSSPFGLNFKCPFLYITTKLWLWIRLSESGHEKSWLRPDRFCRIPHVQHCLCYARSSTAACSQLPLPPPSPHLLLYLYHFLLANLVAWKLFAKSAYLLDLKLSNSRVIESTY